MTNPIQAILIGAGQRGAEAYGAYALSHPEDVHFVAVAEPDTGRRERFAAMHAISPEYQFESWEPLLARPLLAQAALICTQDQMHTPPALSALDRGYDVLLEKPMATSLAECQQLVQSAEENGRQLHIAHVLRYTPHFQKMREIIQSGALGQIVHVNHQENVSFWHMAHSYVRGNWRSTAQSSPMILAKCCHDLDILIWLLNDTCQTMSSTGNLLHFRPENMPDGAPAYCVDGCPAADSCPFFAPLIYADRTPLWRNMADSASGITRQAIQWQLRSPRLVRALSKVIPPLRQVSEYRGWPSNLVSSDGEREHIMAELARSPYGRCVYQCDNDVVDHQVVNMVFTNGTTVTLTMHGLSHDEGRTTRIQGARGELEAAFLVAGSWIEVREHRTGKRTRYDTTAHRSSGHGGGDAGLMAGFAAALRQNDPSLALTSARFSLESHLMAFAAEEARLGSEIIQMEAYRKSDLPPKKWTSG
ncbi:MAG: Gfo/Idh/MocA family oxidoreductase [Chloroflexi bacterium]|nr:Gfo/Idh/MocA family oxidoreductase [Chloroflexota bacterium]